MVIKYEIASEKIKKAVLCYFGLCLLSCVFKKQYGIALYCDRPTCLQLLYGLTLKP